MKIYKTSVFEKMNINKISLDDLSNLNLKIFEYKLLDLNKLKSIRHIQYGYIVKTVFCETDPINIWMYFDHRHIKKIIPNYPYSSNALVKPDDHTAEKIAFLETSGYATTFPKYDDYSIFTIIDVYQTNVDLDWFETSYDIYNYFKEYKIIEQLS